MVIITEIGLKLSWKSSLLFVLCLPVTERGISSELPQWNSMETLGSEDTAMPFYFAPLKFLKDLQQFTTFKSK